MSSRKTGKRKSRKSEYPESQSSQGSNDSNAELAALILATHTARREKKKGRSSRRGLDYSSESPYRSRSRSNEREPAAGRGWHDQPPRPPAMSRVPSMASLNAAPISSAAAFGGPMLSSGLGMPAPVAAKAPASSQAAKKTTAAPALGAVEEGEEPPARPVAIGRSSSRSRAQPAVKPIVQKMAAVKQPAIMPVSGYAAAMGKDGRGVSPSEEGPSRGWIPADVFEFRGTQTEIVQAPAPAAGGGSSRMAVVVASPAAEERIQRAETLNPIQKRREILRMREEAERAEIEETKAKFPSLKKAAEERESLTPEIEKIYTSTVADKKKRTPVMYNGVQVTHPRLGGTVLVPLFYSKSMIAKICIIALKRRKHFDSLVRKKGEPWPPVGALYLGERPYPTGQELEKWMDDYLHTIWGNPEFCSEITNFHTDVIGQNLALRDPDTMKIIRTSNDFDQISDIGKAQLEVYLQQLRKRLNLINKTISEFERPGIVEPEHDDTFLGQVLPAESKKQLKTTLATMDRRINEVLRVFRRDHPSGEISESLYNSLSAIASYGTITVITSTVGTGAALSVSPYARQALIRAVTSQQFAQVVGTTFALSCPGMISHVIGNLVDITLTQYDSICEQFNLVKHNVLEVKEDIYQCINGVFFAAADERPSPPSLAAGGGAAVLETAVDKMGEKITEICWVYEPRNLALATHDEAAMAWGHTLRKSLKKLDREHEEREMELALALMYEEESEKPHKGGSRNTRKYKKHSGKRRSHRSRK